MFNGFRLDYNTRLDTGNWNTAEHLEGNVRKYKIRECSVDPSFLNTLTLSSTDFSLNK